MGPFAGEIWLRRDPVLPMTVNPHTDYGTGRARRILYASAHSRSRFPSGIGARCKRAGAGEKSAAYGAFIEVSLQLSELKD